MKVPAPRSSFSGLSVASISAVLGDAKRKHPRAAISAAAMLALVVLVGSYFAFRDRPAVAEECKEMLERYIDMSIAADPELARLPPAEQAAAREIKRAIRTEDKSFTRVERQCEREVSRREHSCAMKAPTPNDWEACID